MPLHLGLPHSGHQQEASRQARRELQQKVRNDWNYPSAPHPDTHTEAGKDIIANGINGSNDSNRSHSIDAKAAVTARIVSDPAANGHLPVPRLDFEPLGWRGREYSENESSSDGEEAVARPQTGSLFRPRPKSKRKADVGESTESVADRKQARKRRRQERFEEEMGWNIGLAHFSAQRNAWTCACKDSQSSLLPSASSSHNGTNGHAEQQQQEAGANAMEIDEPTASLSDQPKLSLALAEDASVSLPIAPRLLPSHPVRARITTSSYSEIYSKIIVQGRTPTVPINLQDITSALVHGWKEEGNWPPKIAAVEPSLSKKKESAEAKDKDKDAANATEKGHTSHLTRGVKVIGKVFHGLTGGPMDGGRGRASGGNLA